MNNVMMNIWIYEIFFSFFFFSYIACMIKPEVTCQKLTDNITDKLHFRNLQVLLFYFSAHFRNLRIPRKYRSQSYSTLRPPAKQRKSTCKLALISIQVVVHRGWDFTFWNNYIFTPWKQLIYLSYITIFLFFHVSQFTYKHNHQPRFVKK